MEDAKIDALDSREPFETMLLWTLHMLMILLCNKTFTLSESQDHDSQRCDKILPQTFPPGNFDVISFSRFSGYFVAKSQRKPGEKGGTLLVKHLKISVPGRG